MELAETGVVRAIELKLLTINGIATRSCGGDF